VSGHMTAMALESPPRPSAESARLTPEQVCESDYALRFGALSATTDQLCAVVDEFLRNVDESSCPRLIVRVREALKAAKIASCL